MNVSFQIDNFDQDGDCFDECIMLHFGDSAIIKFKTYREFSVFVDSLQSIRNEIRENLSKTRIDKELAQLSDNSG